MEIIILICFVILSVLCICMLSTILFFMDDCDKRLCSLEDAVYDIRINKASYQYLNSFKNDLEDDIRSLRSEIYNACEDYSNLEAQLNEHKNVFNGLRDDISELKSSINIENDSFSEYQKSIECKLSKLNLTFDCLYEDYKRLKIKVKRLEICEVCNDMTLRSHARKINIFLGEKEKNA